jgi:Kelch motif/Galactose oxidase, central domain
VVANVQYVDRARSGHNDVAAGQEGLGYRRRDGDWPYGFGRGLQPLGASLVANRIDDDASRESYATLLSDGRVLVAGGLSSDSSGGIVSAELYDSGSGKWLRTGSMSTPRESQSAELLATGAVLVSGGDVDIFDGPTGRAEVYHPKTGKWTPTGRMMTSRSSHIGVTLADGSAIVSGGDYGNSAGFNPLAMTDRYNSKTNRWSPVGDMRVAPGAVAKVAGRAFHTATKLADGRVLVSGGLGYITDFTQTVILQTAEIFDPSSATWRLTGNMNQPRAQHAAVALGDGRVLVAGGYDFGPPLTSAEIFSPKSQAASPPDATSMRPGFVPPRVARRARLASGHSHRMPRPIGVLRRRRSGAPPPSMGTWMTTASMHVARSSRRRCCKTAKCSSKDATLLAPAERPRNYTILPKEPGR